MESTKRLLQNTDLKHFLYQNQIQTGTDCENKRDNEVHTYYDRFAHFNTSVMNTKSFSNRTGIPVHVLLILQSYEQKNGIEKVSFFLAKFFNCSLNISPNYFVMPIISA